MGDNIFWIAQRLKKYSFVRDDWHETKAAIARGDYVRLAGRRVLPREDFERLAYHEKRIAYALAVGQTVNKGVIGGVAAARLNGLWVIHTGGGEKVDVILKSNKPPKKHWREGYRYRTYAVAPEHTREIFGATVTDPIQTWIDVTRWYGFRAGLVVADSLIHMRLATKEQMAARLEGMGRFRGIADVRRTLGYAAGYTESPWESFVRAIFIEAGISYVIQAQVLGYRADFLIAEFIVVEVDGMVKYKTDPEKAWGAEKTRHDALQNVGYVVLRFTPAELARDPGIVLRRIDDVLNGRGMWSAGRWVA